MLKKTILLVLALGLALSAVVLVRAQGLESRQPVEVESVAIPVDEEGSLLRFAEALRIPTISFENVEDTDSAQFRALHDHFVLAYPGVHAELTREIVGGLSLLYTWEGTEPELPPVVLMGHQDVVPVIPGTEDDWEQAPFGGVVADGFIWGRGSMDNKISVVAILEAVEALVADGFRPRRTHYLAFGHDEEVGGMLGAAAIAELLESRGAEPYAYVMDEGGVVARGLVPGIEGPVAIIGVAEKGYVNLELVVKGPGGHSSAPPENTNIGILAAAITRLEDNPFPASLDGPALDMFRYLAPEMGLAGRALFANEWLTAPLIKWGLLSSPSSAAMLRTTTAVTIVEGGVKANVLPIEARAIVNHRIRPGETSQTVREYVTSVIDDDRVEVNFSGGEGFDPSPISDPAGPAFQLLARTVQEVVQSDRVFVTPYLVTGGTDAKHYSGRSANVFRFIPAPVEPDALQRVHGTNERMTPDGFFSSIRFFRRLIQNSDDL